MFQMDTQSFLPYLPVFHSLLVLILHFILGLRAFKLFTKALCIIENRCWYINIIFAIDCIEHLSTSMVLGRREVISNKFIDLSAFEIKFKSTSSYISVDKNAEICGKVADSYCFLLSIIILQFNWGIILRCFPFASYFQGVFQVSSLKVEEITLWSEYRSIHKSSIFIWVPIDCIVCPLSPLRSL